MEDSLSVLSIDNSKDDPQSIATICNPFNKSAENIIELPSWHTFRHLFGCRKGLLQVTDGFLQILTLLLLIHQFLCQRDHQQRDPKPLSCHSHAEDFLVMLLQSRGKHLIPLKNIIFWCILRDENYLRKKNKKLIYKTLRSKFWTGNAIFNLPRNGFYKFITTQIVQIQPEPPKY